MPIYDQTFRKYEGTRSTGKLWWSVARLSMRPILKNKIARFLWIGVLAHVIFYSVILFISANVEQRLPPGHADAFEQVSQIEDIPLFGRKIGVNTVIYSFLVPQITLIVVLIVVSGGGTVASDLRHNALPLYFSRPLRPWQYILGKVLGLALAPALVTWIAALLIYLQVIAYYRPISAVATESGVVLAALVFTLCCSGFCALMMVATSSLCRKASTASVMFMGLFFLTQVAAGVLRNTLNDRRFSLLAPGIDLQTLGHWLFQPNPVWLDPREQMRITSLSFPAAIAALLIYAIIALLVVRRNLRVVETVK